MFGGAVEARPRGRGGRGGWLSRCAAPLARALVASLALGLSAGCATSLKLTLLAAATRPPSDVALYLDVADAAGRPVVGLQAGDFRIYEDGRLVSSAGSGPTLADPALAARHYTLLLIEISSAMLVSDQVGAIGDAVTAWLARVGAEQRVAVYAFDGGKGLVEVVPFRDQPLDVGHTRADLRRLEVRDPASNLNGAVLLGLGELGRALRGADVPLRFGSLVVLADGTDRASRISQRQMLDAVDAAPFRVFTLGMGRELDDSLLARIGKTGYVRVEETTAMRAAFHELGDLILRASQRQYLLRHCVTARAGKHTLTVEVNTPQGRGELRYPYQLDERGSTGPCNPASPPPQLTLQKPGSRR